jgi:hypothetical protein
MSNSILIKIQRKLSDFYERISQIPSDIAYLIARAKYVQDLPRLAPFEQKIVEACKREGAFITSLDELGLTSTSKLLKAATAQLDSMEKVLSASRVNKDDTENQTAGTHPQIFMVTDLPEFLTWGREERLSKIIENYIGLPITFQGVHLRRDFANKNPVTTELWHKDLEDRRMLKIIVYLSDVTEENGPFEYIPKNRVSPLLAWRIQRKISRAHALGISDSEIDKLVPKSAWKRCLGSAGTVVFMDPVAIFHHGKSRQMDRSALFFVYTAKQPLRPEHCTQYRDQTFARPELV